MYVRHREGLLGRKRGDASSERVGILALVKQDVAAVSGKKPIEVEYVFPITSWALSSLKIWLRGKVIQSQARRPEDEPIGADSISKELTRPAWFVPISSTTLASLQRIWHKLMSPQKP
jgi:hypothetical protein